MGVRGLGERGERRPRRGRGRSNRSSRAHAVVYVETSRARFFVKATRTKPSTRSTVRRVDVAGAFPSASIGPGASRSGVFGGCERTHLAHGRAVRRVEVDVVLPDEEHVAHALRPRRGHGRPRLERRRRGDALHRRPPRARRFEKLRRRRRRVHPHAAGKRRAAVGDVLPAIRKRRGLPLTRNHRRVLGRRRRCGGRLAHRLRRESLALSPHAWIARGQAARIPQIPAAATLSARDSRFARARRANCKGSKTFNGSRSVRARPCDG